ncbi:MAG: hypothetical protein ACRDCE_10485 [Cetobacterium sp.]|uniref:hypothetical protein n=1 Tax=Cetobacterium sp. TaxID=2071632 RepID=UPI003EE65911
MFKFFMNLFAKKKPAELNDIVSEIETKVQQLNDRIEYDKAEVEAKSEEQKKLEQEKADLGKNIERATRIKARFEDTIQ